MGKDYFTETRRIGGIKQTIEILAVWAGAEEVDYFAVNIDGNVIRIRKNENHLWEDLEGITSDLYTTIGKTINSEFGSINFFKP